MDGLKSKLSFYFLAERTAESASQSTTKFSTSPKAKDSTDQVTVPYEMAPSNHIPNGMATYIMKPRDR